RPDPNVSRVLGSGARRHPSADLLLAATLVVDNTRRLGGRGSDAKRIFWYIDPRRRGDIAGVIPEPQLPSGILALPCHFTWRRLVCSGSALLWASPAVVDGHHPGLREFRAMSTRGKSQSANSAGHSYSVLSTRLLYTLFRFSSRRRRFSDVLSSGAWA